MRIIKFRGKRIDTGEWVYGDLTRYSESMSYITVDLVEGKVYEVDARTVGQYTGLNDKNGKEIYEGDLLQISDYPGENYWVEIATSDYPPHNFIQGYRKKPLANVRGISDGIFETLEPENIEECEVIGNIHDNKEAT
jgi:uncharacterized phage protein (TIGR01671 family)